MLLLHPSAPDPAEDYAELTVAGPDTLRLETVPGFGSPGETVEYEWAADGSASRVRAGGISAGPGRLPVPAGGAGGRVTALLLRRARLGAAVRDVLVTAGRVTAIADDLASGAPGLPVPPGT